MRQIIGSSLRVLNIESVGIWIRWGNKSDSASVKRWFNINIIEKQSTREGNNLGITHTHIHFECSCAMKNCTHTHKFQPKIHFLSFSLLPSISASIDPKTRANNIMQSEKRCEKKTKIVCVDVWKCIKLENSHTPNRTKWATRETEREKNHWHRVEWHFPVENGNKFVTLVSRSFFFSVVFLSAYPFRCVWILARIPFFLDSVITYVAKRRYHFCTLLWWKITKSSTHKKESVREWRERKTEREHDGKKHHPENCVFIELSEWCCLNEKWWEEIGDEKKKWNKEDEGDKNR